MKRTRSILTLMAFCLLVPACYGQATRQDRIKALNQYSTTNDFMTLFLKFVKENHLSETLIDYEDMLVNKKYLDGYNQTSLNKYFGKLINEQDGSRCISKSLLERIRFAVFNFDYAVYKQAIEQKELRGSKEYNFIEYLKSGGPMWRESLEYALKDNKLTPDKKYFYLLLTTPSKTCN